MPGEKTELADSILKKQFRFSDWFAERVIKTVAFLVDHNRYADFCFCFPGNPASFSHAKTGNCLMPGIQLQILTADCSRNPIRPVNRKSADLKPETYGAVPDSIPEKAEDSAAIPAETNRLYRIDCQQSENRKAIGTFLSRDWQPVSENPRYGLIPLFFGTLKVTLIAIFFAAPISILAALYTAMFAPKKIREYIKPAVELLAGFPSVVIGFFALMILASFFQDLLGYSGRLNAFVGGIAMALAAIPVIYTLTEDALSAVPKTYMEASLGLGASLRQTAFSVILPAATPGIFAAVLLGIGRVFGETMIALMATGNAALITLNPFDSVRTLSATIGAEMAEVVFGDTHYSVLFLIGSLLFIFTFILNALAEFYFRNRLIRRFQGKKS